MLEGVLDNSYSVAVQSPAGTYKVRIEPGLLTRLGSIQTPASTLHIIITDANVKSLYGESLEKSFRDAGRRVLLMDFPPGEDHKTIATASDLYDRILPAGVERSSLVIALGGGLVGDLAGFVAATLLRGVPFLQVPTTLLAMVDASVGGKTGVNHAVGKNLIGAFHQPREVMIDPAVLKTLPADELRGGLAECIKHEIIRDAEGFTELEKTIDSALAVDVPYLAKLVAHNVAIKAAVVAADPFEHGERAHLNFGHTFGHAIETLSDYRYSHGQSVALGMVAASRLATRLKMLDADSRDRIIALIRKAGLPTGGLELATQSVLDAMLFDKKVKDRRVRFILPDRIGHVVIRDNVPADMVKSAVESLRSRDSPQ
ncbi:MAG TPA: 3-dehydroquinate synthase [Tepidisphaeraceae bacterium]|nr:3-dehydroquinate synthase [Tepidisphaeraceae bacterium]